MAPDRPPAVLVVDDVPAVCEELAAALRGGGLRPTTCLDPTEATELAARGSFGVIVLTLVMKKLGGLALIRSLRGAQVATPILMVTRHGGSDAAIEAIRLGASDYADQPVSPDELLARVRALLRDDRETAAAGRSMGMVTHDLAMKRVLETIEAVAPTRSRVLILGETGTGKQILARAIHRRSDRAEGPMVEVNCAAIPEQLLESELFGHEKGSFTGATARRIGRFEQAGAGTIFLDEVGEMDAALQSKLLHVLEDGTYQRVGSSVPRKSRARVVAATNRDLKDDVDAGRFRADLYYRLNVIAIPVPPLRERPGDIPPLVEHFLKLFRERGQPQKRFSPEALRVLGAYAWPGNVRELQNLVERLAILHRGEQVEPADLPERIAGAHGSAPPPTGIDAPFREARAAFERGYIAEAIRRAEGNLAAAARLAGLDRGQFHRLAAKHGVLPERGKR